MVGYDNDPHGDQYGRPRRPGHNWKMIGIIVGVALAVIVAVAAIASSGSQATDPAGVASPLPTPVVAATTPAEVPSAPTSQVPAPAATTEAPPATTAEEDQAPLTATVPDVVGKDLQSAQEELFPPLRSTSIDATGQGRSQIVDSNWVVVRQEPAAGTVVRTLTDIKLFVVKQGESTR